MTTSSSKRPQTAIPRHRARAIRGQTVAAGMPPWCPVPSGPAAPVQISSTMKTTRTTSTPYYGGQVSYCIVLFLDTFKKRVYKISCSRFKLNIFNNKKNHQIHLSHIFLQSIPKLLSLTLENETYLQQLKRNEKKNKQKIS